MRFAADCHPFGGRGIMAVCRLPGVFFMAVTVESVVKQLEDSGIVAAGNLKDFVPPKAHPKSVDDPARLKMPEPAASGTK
jgi:hypothetical protein